MPPTETLRLFVALDPPEPVRSALGELVRPLRGVSWTPPHRYHVSLRFLGETPLDKRAAIELALAGIRVESFILPVEGAGSFPPNRPARVLFVGVGKGHPRLFQLRQRIDDALLGCGLTGLDVRTFHPHVTLARCGPGAIDADVRQFLREHDAFEAPPFRANAFTLYQSELRADGAVHTPLLRVGLSGSGG